MLYPSAAALSVGAGLLLRTSPCPGPVRDILLRAAQRLQIPTVFVANKRLTLPRSELVSTVQVGAGLDVADSYIASSAQAGDLAVTQDIPLAALLVPKGVVVLDPRGELFTEENIAERLSVQDGHVTVDVPARRIHLEVSDEELAQRRAAWTPRPPRFERGYGWMFSRHILQADEGCDFDFLETAFGAPVAEPDIF